MRIVVMIEGELRLALDDDGDDVIGKLSLDSSNDVDYLWTYVLVNDAYMCSCDEGTDNEAIRSMKEETTEEGIEELWRCLDAGDGVRIFPDGVASPATVIFDEKKPQSSLDFRMDDS
ncbi:hypothetical protein Tco_1009490 [Tanacetum coccineum]